MKKLKRVFLHFLIFCIDRPANVLFRGNSYETISHRLGRIAKEGKVDFPVTFGRYFQSLLYRFLNWLQPGHCEDAIK